jgi:hypothetical protein
LEAVTAEATAEAGAATADAMEVTTEAMEVTAEDSSEEFSTVLETSSTADTDIQSTAVKLRDLTYSDIDVLKYKTLKYNIFQALISRSCTGAKKFSWSCGE